METDPKNFLFTAIYYSYHERATLVKRALQLPPVIYVEISLFSIGQLLIYALRASCVGTNITVLIPPRLITRLRLLMYIFVKLSTFLCILTSYITIFPQKKPICWRKKRKKGRGKEGQRKVGSRDWRKTGGREDR